MIKNTYQITYNINYMQQAFVVRQGQSLSEVVNLLLLEPTFKLSYSIVKVELMPEPH
jgi:hypothetical protein